MKSLIALVVLTLTFVSCASAPTGLSPAGIEAFNKTRVIKELDVIRDLAIDANNQNPPLVSTNTTRSIVTYHRSSLLVINSQGVKAMTTTALDEIINNLPVSEKELLTPYVTLLKTILVEIK